MINTKPWINNCKMNLIPAYLFSRSCFHHKRFVPHPDTRGDTLPWTFPVNTRYWLPACFPALAWLPLQKKIHTSWSKRGFISWQKERIFGKHRNIGVLILVNQDNCLDKSSEGSLWYGKIRKLLHTLLSYY